MRYTCQVISGHGRGKGLGFPTLNLTIPSNFPEKEGIYAAWVHIEGSDYRGALHYGPIPAFQEKTLSLEVFVLDYEEASRPDLVDIELALWLREIRNFSSPEALQTQIAKDVETVYTALPTIASPENTQVAQKAKGQA